MTVNRAMCFVVGLVCLTWTVVVLNARFWVFVPVGVASTWFCVWAGVKYGRE
jgi:hypothetical protein